jgi:hypothetical protein
MMSLLLSLALAASGTDTAANTQPATETAAKPKKAKPELICRRVADTGTRVPTRECRSQEEWNRQADTISHRQNNGQ